MVKASFILGETFDHFGKQGSDEKNNISFFKSVNIHPKDERTAKKIDGNDFLQSVCLFYECRVLSSLLIRINTAESSGREFLMRLQARFGVEPVRNKEHNSSSF